MGQVSQGGHTVWIIYLWAVVIFERQMKVREPPSAEKEEAGQDCMSVTSTESWGNWKLGDGKMHNNERQDSLYLCCYIISQ